MGGGIHHAFLSGRLQRRFKETIMQVAQRQGGRWGNRRGSSEVSVASRGGCMEQREGEARRTLNREQNGRWWRKGARGCFLGRGRRPGDYRLPQDSSSLSFCRHFCRAAFNPPAVTITCGVLLPAPLARNCARPQQWWTMRPSKPISAP